MSKSLEKLADQMINLSPEESQKLALIIKAKLMPEVAKQQQQGLLQQANNPMMQQMGKRPNMQMPMPNAAQAAQQGLLRR
tara:strand:+ start:102 stop:341 length:240 start_codon:yes stop_codon:yes gene_type:complete